jgi:hypothetical protein
MAFPTVVNSASTSSTASGTTSLSLSIPSSIVSGNLLLAVCAALHNTSLSMSGWTQVGTLVGSNALAVFAKTAAGGDTGTLTTSGSAETFGVTVFQVSGWSGSISDVGFAGGVQSSGAPNPPSLTMPVSADYLWFACGSAGSACTAAPANYTNRINSPTASGCIMNTAQRQLTATTEDPGAFTGGFTASSGVATLAIAPVSGPAVLTRSISDSAPATESCTHQFVRTRTSSDSASATDARTRHAAYSRTVSDVASAVDVATRGIATNQRRSIGETLAATDLATAHRSFYLSTATITESAPASDEGTEVTGSLPAPLLRLSALVGDTTLVIATALNKLMTFPPSLSSSANTGTNVVRSASLTETLGATDAVTSFTDQKLTESASATDAAAFAYIRGVLDAAAATDVATAPVYVSDVFDVAAPMSTPSMDELTSNISYVVNTSDVALGRFSCDDVAVAS